MSSHNSDRFAGQLVRELYSVQDKVSRTILLGEKLRILDDEQAVEILQILCNKGSKNVPIYQEIFISVVDIPNLSRVIGHGKMSAIYLLAQERGYEDVVRILSRPTAVRRRQKKDEEVPVDPEMEYVPLGVRKSLAKGQVRKYLDRLLLDQDPSVVANILLNPRITEREVLKVASRRPSRPSVLKVIYESKKWISRYAVKKALVRNPYTPPEIALRLLGFMLTPDLHSICHDESLHPDLVAAAKLLLEEKSP